MVGLIDARSPEVYKLMTANKRSDIPPISAESWTEHLQLICATTRERAWRATWTIRPSCTSSATQWPVTIWTSFSFWHCNPTRSWWQVRSLNTTFQRSNEQAPVYELLPYILWLPLSRKTFQTWTCSPAQIMIHSLLLSSNTQRKQFRMIDHGKRHTGKFLLPFLLTCSIHSFQTVSWSPHIFGTKSKKLRLCTKKVQLRPPKNIVCWLSMVVSIDFLQTWSGTCWRTGLLLNIKYQTLNLVSAPQGTPTPLYSLPHSRNC